MLNQVLRLLRISQDWTIKELSTKIGVASSYISEIEKGVKKPSVDILEKYSKAMGIKTSTIMYFVEMGNENNYGYQKLLLKMLENAVGDRKQKQIKISRIANKDERKVICH